MDLQKFDEANNAWLLTLPESRTGDRYQPACRVVVIRTLKETYSPASGSLDVKRKLAGRTCTLSLYWNGGGWHQEPEYKAELTVNIWDGTTELDLTNSDFMLDYNLRGRGLGSWIMIQLISWAKTLRKYASSGSLLERYRIQVRTRRKTIHPLNRRRASVP